MLSCADRTKESLASAILSALSESILMPAHFKSVLLILEKHDPENVTIIEMQELSNPYDKLEGVDIPESERERLTNEHIQNLLTNHVVEGALVSFAVIRENGDRADLKQVFSEVAMEVPTMLDTSCADWDFRWGPQLNEHNPRVLAVLLTPANANGNARAK